MDGSYVVRSDSIVHTNFEWFHLCLQVQAHIVSLNGPSFQGSWLYRSYGGAYIVSTQSPLLSNSTLKRALWFPWKVRNRTSFCSALLITPSASLIYYINKILIKIRNTRQNNQPHLLDEENLYKLHRVLCFAALLYWEVTDEGFLWEISSDGICMIEELFIPFRYFTWLSVLRSLSKDFIQIAGRV